MTTSKRKPAAAAKPSARKPAARTTATAKPATKAAGGAAAKRPAAPPDFPVVGIGASAGGLAAIEEFLAAMPSGESSGMAFVLVQHLDPDHKSLLLDLVQRYTQMEVNWAEDGMEVHPGCAYVMPPNKDMALIGGRLALLEPEAPRGLRLPIDYFFRSLAADRRERAVCIVLSGTGSDGTLGLRAVKGEGGMAIAQSPETAAYDGMPRSAIDTGLVDYVLAPAEMPEQLLGYASRAFGRSRRPARTAAPDQLTQVLHLLRERSGHDFTHYKANTLLRRVERRMAVTRIEHMEDYVALLRRDSLEIETLFRELLIGVTNFFRDAPAFEVLATEVLPHLVRSRAPGDPVRVWVPGCSTGEEAYSIAMLVQEVAAEARRSVPAQVFATDIDAEAIERARVGRVPREHRRRRLARAPGALLRAGRRHLPCRQDGARLPGLRQAGRHQGPSLLARRPHQLPQPAHLHGPRSATDGSCRCSTTRSTPTATCFWAAPRPSATPATSSPRSTRSGSCSSAGARSPRGAGC